MVNLRRRNGEISDSCRSHAIHRDQRTAERRGRKKKKKKDRDHELLGVQADC